MNEKYPVLNIPEEFIGVLEEHGAGYVYVEKLLRHLVDLALKHQNASVQENTEVLSYE